jgi:hypothetical protein
MPSGGQLLRELHIPWPAANEGSLRTAAADWHSLAETIRDNYGQANSNAASLTSNNSGTAINAFETYWDKIGGKSGALPRAADACDVMSKACTQYADAVATTKSKIEEAGAEVAATLVVGTALAFFTFGATEGIADSVAASLLATVAGYIEELAATVSDLVLSAGTYVTQALADLIATAGTAVGEALTSETATGLASSVLSGTASGVGSAAGTDAATDAFNQLTGDKPLSSGDVAKDLLVAGVAGGGTAGLLSKLGEMSATQVSRLLSNSATGVSESNPQLYVDMMTLSKQLEGTSGKVTAGVLSSVASQLITAQQVNAEGVVSDQLVDAMSRAAEG